LDIKLFHFDYAKIVILFCALFFPCYFIAEGINSNGLLFLGSALLVIYVLYMLLWFIFFGKKELPLILKTFNLK
tara:strand:+ start:49 stop:270 length:222 start_codon:yes stop_codon:yes gene_type:complete